jgi:hypothetical protein
MSNPGASADLKARTVLLGSAFAWRVLVDRIEKLDPGATKEIADTLDNIILEFLEDHNFAEFGGAAGVLLCFRRPIEGTRPYQDVENVVNTVAARHAPPAEE